MKFQGGNVRVRGKTLDFQGGQLKKKKSENFLKVPLRSISKKIDLLEGGGEEYNSFLQKNNEIKSETVFYKLLLHFRNKKTTQTPTNRRSKKKKLKINKYKYNHTGNVADVRMVQERHAFLL